MKQRNFTQKRSSVVLTLLRTLQGLVLVEDSFAVSALPLLSSQRECVVVALDGSPSEVRAVLPATARCVDGRVAARSLQEVEGVVGQQKQCDVLVLWSATLLLLEEETHHIARWAVRALQRCRALMLVVHCDALQVEPALRAMCSTRLKLLPASAGFAVAFEHLRKGGKVGRGQETLRWTAEEGLEPVVPPATSPGVAPAAAAPVASSLLIETSDSVAAREKQADEFINPFINVAKETQGAAAAASSSDEEDSEDPDDDLDF